MLARVDASGVPRHANGFRNSARSEAIERQSLKLSHPIHDPALYRFQQYLRLDRYSGAIAETSGMAASLG